MIVRAVTPEGSFGKVFGFVSMGFSIGGVIAPLIYGWLMDLNEPRLVFLVAVGFTVLALAARSRTGSRNQSQLSSSTMIMKPNAV